MQGSRPRHKLGQQATELLILWALHGAQDPSIAERSSHPELTVAQVRYIVSCGAAGVPDDVPAAKIQLHEVMLPLGQRVIQPELLCLQPRTPTPRSPPQALSFLCNVLIRHYVAGSTSNLPVLQGPTW